MRLKRKNLYLIGAIFAVIVLGVVLGTYSFYRGDTKRTTSLPGFSKDTGQGGKNASEGPNLTPLPTGEAIIIPPPPEASKSAFQQYRANIEYNAVASNNVSIKNCIASPLVVKVVQGSKITLTNTDKTDHTIMINEDNTFTIKSGEKKEILADFGKGFGIYSYECDNSMRPVGIVLVRESL